LEKDGTPLPIGGRALDLLVVLAEHAGEVVDKRELVKRVWTDVNVDEGSLRFHITALRKALGDGTEGVRYIVNVPGRGYCFAAPLARAAPSGVPSVGRIASPHSLPAPLAKMIGRTEAIEKISSELSAHRFVTVVGPGGIGKTSVAVTLGHRQFADFAGQSSLSISGPSVMIASFQAPLPLHRADRSVLRTRHPVCLHICMPGRCC
jgi:DNA-binding winged helix-turn-helix (wHTH) protein